MNPIISALLTTGVALSVSAAEPAFRDIPYDSDNEAQVLDVYLASGDAPKPTMVYIHGGGWRAGTKDRVPTWLSQANEEGWLTVVSVEYRFTDVATHPAQVDDCARAIQFVRHNAKNWNIDPQRIGVTGGSAGGHLSSYVALSEDKAEENSADPIARQSSRVAFAIPFAGPSDWRLLKTIEHNHPAYRQLIGYEPGTPANEFSEELIHDVSPIRFVTDDDPPFLIVHGDADATVPIDHAKALHQALQDAGVPSELMILKDAKHDVAGAGIGDSPNRATEFVRARFGIESTPTAP